MEETAENAQERKPKICKLAIASPLVVVFGFLGLLSLLFIPSSGLRAIIIYSPPFIGLGLGIAACWKIHKSRGMLKGYILSISGIGLSIFFIANINLERAHDRHRMERAMKISCSVRLAELGKALQAYSDHYDKYPTKDKWCDLLVEYGYGYTRDPLCYVCPGASKNHYAINPNCSPHSPPNTVLLFETKGGWNQYGGPEILTTENHAGKGCNILFNSGDVNFVETKQLGELKWDNGQANPIIGDDGAKQKIRTPQ